MTIGIGDTVTRRRNTLDSLWQKYLSQPSKISPETQAYVAALKGRIDVLEYNLAATSGALKQHLLDHGDHSV